ncbi:MAG: hypothetical protein WA628_08630 [Terriglobales bacterium]
MLAEAKWYPYWDREDGACPACVQQNLLRTLLSKGDATYATRLGAGGVADEWVTQLLRQGDAKVVKKYSQMKTADEARGSGKVEPDDK